MFDRKLYTLFIKGDCFLVFSSQPVEFEYVAELLQFNASFDVLTTPALALTLIMSKQKYTGNNC
jgi:hypothetical protein